MNVKNFIKAGILAGGLIGTPLLAQQSDSMGTTSSGNTSSTTDGGRQDRGFNWGWLGLIGLVGLAGLKTNKPEHGRP